MQYWGADSSQKNWTVAGEAGEVAFATEIREFVRDILENRQPLYTINDAWATMAVIEAAYESVRQGQPVKVARREKSTNQCFHSKGSITKQPLHFTITAVSYFSDPIIIFKCIKGRNTLSVAFLMYPGDT